MPTKHILTLQRGVIREIHVATDQPTATHPAEQDTSAAPLITSKPADESSLPSPEWELKVFQDRNQNRTCWVSPDLKIPFRLRQRALIFERLRRKFHGDELQAWYRYSQRKGPRYVIAGSTFDVASAPASKGDGDYVLTMRGRLESSGWTRNMVKKDRTERFKWVSPTFKIPFGYPKVAFHFENLRQRCDEDEARAFDLFVEEKRREGKRVSDFIEGGLAAAELLIQNGGRVPNREGVASDDESAIGRKTRSQRGSKRKAGSERGTRVGTRRANHRRGLAARKSVARSSEKRKRVPNRIERERTEEADLWIPNADDLVPPEEESARHRRTRSHRGSNTKLGAKGGTRVNARSAKHRRGYAARKSFAKTSRRVASSRSARPGRKKHEKPAETPEKTVKRHPQLWSDDAAGQWCASIIESLHLERDYWRENPNGSHLPLVPIG